MAQPDPDVRPISAEASRPLRRAILRPHQPPDACRYPGDEDEDTLHAGAFANGALVGVASFFHQPPPDEDDVDAWRLRGMAVRAGARRQGYGRALLEAGLEHIIVQQGGTRLWFNARTSAAPFYRSHGFTTKGEVFDLPPIGPHYFMEKLL